MKSDEDIQDFWHWFKANRDAFGDTFENEALLRELGERVSALGPVGWEVGPGCADTASNSLTISPAGDAEVLPLTRRIVASAPSCPGWEFHWAKPPKRWDRKYIIEDPKGVDVLVNAAHWRYILRRYPDGLLDVVLKAPEICRWAEDEWTTAALILLDGELGEELRITRIHAVEVVCAFDQAQDGIPIVHLRDHVVQIASSA